VVSAWLIARPRTGARILAGTRRRLCRPQRQPTRGQRRPGPAVPFQRRFSAVSVRLP